jgi:hypothetical protein
MSEPEASLCMAFWSGTEERWLSRTIVRVTGRRLTDGKDRWSHMGVAFKLTDGTEEYYEALFGRPVQGPKPVNNLVDWYFEKRWSRRIELALLPIAPAACENKRRLLKTWVGTVGYAEWQLLGMWAVERLRMRLPKSPNRVVCSELAARILAPEVDLTDARHPTPDYVNPNSAYRRWREIAEGKRGSRRGAEGAEGSELCGLRAAAGAVA